MTGFKPHGIMTALVTPFNPDFSINYSVMEELIDSQVTAGVSGIVVTAGSGEYVTLQPEERAEVIHQSAISLGGRLPLVAGVLAPDTMAAISAAKAAEQAGAQAILLLTPYYIAPSPAGIVSHFRQVADAVSLPIILYNIPARTGINLDLPLLEQIAEIGQVVGIKECDRDLGRVALKIKTLGSRLAFLSGDDDLSLPNFSLGAAGAIMASSNLIAPWAVTLDTAVRAGHWEEAREIFYGRILPTITLYRGPDHPGPLKEALGVAGFPVGTGRAPLHPISKERRAEMRRVIRELGLMRQD